MYHFLYIIRQGGRLGRGLVAMLLLFGLGDFLNLRVLMLTRLVLRFAPLLNIWLQFA